MLSLYRDQIRVSAVRFSDELGYVLTMPRAASQYDSSKYLSAVRVVFTATNTNVSCDLMNVMVQTILNVTSGEPFAVKTIDGSLITALRDAMDNTRAIRYERCKLREAMRLEPWLWFEKTMPIAYSIYVKMPLNRG
jgi:hypothetical protein